MTKISLPCKHVSHTAWLVAAFRAQESKRPDAHFRDNLAAKLLGAFEEEYLSRFSEQLREDPWLLTIRTYYIDRMIEKSIKIGIKTIVNLGAGLDTRPYRLALPSDVQWFEADYAELNAYKDEKLKDEKPLCKLERISADLSITRERLKVFKRVKDCKTPTLVLTEGLLGYLSEQNVISLAKELHAIPSCEYWLMDVVNKSMIKTFHGKWPEGLQEKDDVQLDFVPNNTAAFLGPLGWNLKEFVSFQEGALKLNRFPLSIDKEAIQKGKGFAESGICLFQAKGR